MNTMNDKRDTPRHDTVLYLPIVGTQTGREIGRLADISAGGALVVSSDAIELNSEIEVTIVLPSGLFGSGHALHGTLTPKWRKPDRNPSLILTGCILAVDTESAGLVENLTQRYSFSSGHTDFRRLFEGLKAEAEKEQ